MNTIINSCFREEDDTKKRARLPQKSTDGFEGMEKIVKANPIKDQARKPPGILGRMSTKKVIKASFLIFDSVIIFLLL